MSLNLSQVYSNALCNLQLIVDKLDMEVAVGPFNNDDWLFLASGYSLLNWENIITLYANEENAIDFCVKFRDNTNSALLGASICVCDLKEKTFNVHCIERFSRSDVNCKLKGRMVFLVLSLVFLMSFSIKIERIRLIDVDNNAISLINYYKTFCFDSDPKNRQNMIVDLSILESKLK